MTLREAVAISTQHPEARMSFSVNTNDGTGMFASYIDMRVYSPGDGGFMATKIHNCNADFLVEWKTVGHWSLSLIASGTE